MTPAEVHAFIVEQPVPEGWALVPRVVRRHAYRYFWGVEARRHGKHVREWRAYDVRGLMPAVLAFIEAESQPVTVTTDASGHIASIEDVA